MIADYARKEDRQNLARIEPIAWNFFISVFRFSRGGVEAGLGAAYKTPLRALVQNLKNVGFTPDLAPNRFKDKITPVVTQNIVVLNGYFPRRRVEDESRYAHA